MSAPDTGAARKPRRWLAVLLSLLWPGLGHAFVGAPLRGFAIVFGTSLVTAAILLLHIRFATVSLLAVLAAAVIGTWVFIVVDAARIAGPPRTRFLSRRSVLLVCLAFGAVTGVLQLAFEWWSNRWLPQSYYVPSAAMLPTLLIGDHFYADPRETPSRGDVVVYRMARGDSGNLVPYDEHPELPAETFSKRIVGIPGDSIRFDGAALYVNEALRTGEPGLERSTGPAGESLLIRLEVLDSHTYQVADDADRTAPGFATVIVAPERYFLAGDNRDNSNDSRYAGTIHRADIIGRATKIYWSWDNTEPWARMLNPLVVWDLVRNKTRWDRIGQSIE